MSVKLGITGTRPCGYLKDQEERLIVTVADEETPMNAHLYEHLMSHGFRRSHNDVYRPHCESCQACESLRIPVSDFSFSKNQKRVLNKNRDLVLSVVDKPQPDYTSLFCRFIEERHADGAMYPPDPESFWLWCDADWMKPQFFEWRDSAGELMMVSIVDVLSCSSSAMYTFFDPDEAKRSLGTYSILSLIEWTEAQGLDYLYLGYQIDNCDKMNYKARFTPNERLIGNQWKKAVKSNTQK